MLLTPDSCVFFFPPGLQFEFINPIFEFSKGMNELQLNDAEYALLIAINIFSAGKKVVESIGIKLKVIKGVCVRLCMHACMYGGR